MDLSWRKLWQKQIVAGDKTGAKQFRREDVFREVDFGVGRFMGGENPGRRNN